MKIRTLFISFLVAQSLGAVGFLFGGAHGYALLSIFAILLLPGLLVALGVQFISRFESLVALGLTVFLTNAITWIAVWRLWEARKARQR